MVIKISLEKLDKVNVTWEIFGENPQHEKNSVDYTLQVGNNGSKGQ